MHLAMLLALAGAVNAATMQSSVDYAFVDGWSIQQRADGCYMLAGYTPAPNRQQEFTIFVNPEGRASLLFYDSAWQFPEGDRSDLALAIRREESSPVWRELTGTVGREDVGGRTVLIQFDADASRQLRSQIANASNIELFVGETRVISLDIAVNANGLAQLDACVAKIG